MCDFQSKIACISRKDHATALHSVREGEKDPVHEPSATIGERVIRPLCIYHYRRNGTGGQALIATKTNED